MYAHPRLTKIERNKRPLAIWNLHVCGSPIPSHIIHVLPYMILTMIRVQGHRQGYITYRLISTLQSDHEKRVFWPSKRYYFIIYIFMTLRVPVECNSTEIIWSAIDARARVYLSPLNLKRCLRDRFSQHCRTGDRSSFIPQTHKASQRTKYPKPRNSYRHVQHQSLFSGTVRLRIGDENMFCISNTMQSFCSLVLFIRQ